MFHLFNFSGSKPFGLDISDRSIEVISFAGTQQRPRLLGMHRKVLPEGIIKNGDILNKEELEKYLQEIILKPKFGIIKNKDFVFSLPESRMFFHFFVLPKNLLKKDLPNLLEREIKENLPYESHEVYWDFKLSRKKDSAMIAACPKKIVDNFLDIFKNIKITPLVLEPEAESLARILIHEKDKKKNILLLDMGSRTSNLSFFDEGELKFNFLISSAGDKLTEILSESFGVSMQEAEIMKIEIGLNPEKDGGKVFLVMQEEMRAILAKINESISFYSQKYHKDIEKIIITGGSSQIPFLDDYLRDNTGKEIQIGDPWGRIDIDMLKKKDYLAEAMKINPSAFVNASGLAFRGLSSNPKKSGLNLLKEVKLK